MSASCSSSHGGNSSLSLFLWVGVPNTLNVLTSFPFLLVGVPGLVLCLSRCCFGIRFDHHRFIPFSLSLAIFFNINNDRKYMTLIGSLRGEMWGWAFYFSGIAAAAFGSAYYHLKPDDDRVVWDKLPVLLKHLFSFFLRRLTMPFS